MNHGQRVSALPRYPDEIAIELGDGRRIDLSLWLRASASVWWLGFGDADQGGSVVHHEFTLSVERDTSPDLQTEERDPILTADGWRALLAPYSLEHAPEVLTDDQLLLARLASDEYPVSQLNAAARGSWSDWTDANGDERIGEVVERWMRRDGGWRRREGVLLPLIDGSLHWLQHLGVHPRFRGQALGLGLLHHALWSLRRAEGDVAFLHARPYESLFDEQPVTSTVEGVSALIAYYGQLGFRRTLPRQRVTSGGTLMHLQFSRIPRPTTVAGHWSDCEGDE